MSSPVRAAAFPAPAAVETAPAPVDPATKAKKERELAEAARQFEAIFVRSMLAKSGVAGAGKGGTYGDFAVDALAQSVTAGRGLGLGELIRRAVEKSDEALKKSG